MKTYSFKDLSGAFVHPLLGAPLVFAGQIGLKSVTVAMATEKTVQDVGADGTVMSSYIAGDNGQISIVCQQNSITHRALLSWYNGVKIAADLGDVTQFASAAMTMRSLNDGSGHIATGGSIPKLGDKPYAAQGQDVTWVIPFADIQNV